MKLSFWSANYFWSQFEYPVYPRKQMAPIGRYARTGCQQVHQDAVTSRQQLLEAFYHCTDIFSASLEEHASHPAAEHKSGKCLEFFQSVLLGGEFQVSFNKVAIQFLTKKSL